MTRLSLAVSAALFLVTAAGCGKKDEPTSTGAAPSSAASDAAEPVEQDFEEEAEASINAGNLETELAKMEAEVK